MFQKNRIKVSEVKTRTSCEMTNKKETDSVLNEAATHVRKSDELVEKAKDIASALESAPENEQPELLSSIAEVEVEAIGELQQAADLHEDVLHAQTEYTSHSEQLAAAQPSPQHTQELHASLLEAYSAAIEYREIPFILFGELNALELAEAFFNYPIIVKPTLCCVNVASRAIQRDLGFDFNAYNLRITKEQALSLAGYVKPLLPPAIAVPALVELDRFFWADKEMRAAKGNWEKAVTNAINAVADREFKKRKFKVDMQDFEIDAASPPTGASIDFAIDVKRIESPRDIHKRADEIINKAAKFKMAYPEGRFATVVYYPFPNQHLNAQQRLASEYVDGIFFAGASESSIAAAVDLLVGSLGIRRPVE